MNILMYSLGLPPYRRGGLTKYSVDLTKELSKKNRVIFLYPGQINFRRRKLSFKREKSIENFDIFEMINPLPVSLNYGVFNSKYFFEERSSESIRKFLNYVNPDVIHLHTIMGLPLEFLREAKKRNIKIVFTTHDFYGICPKMTISSYDLRRKSLSKEECQPECFICQKGPSFFKLKLMQSYFYREVKSSCIMKYIRKKEKVVSSNKKKTLFNDIEISNRIKLREYYISMFKYIDEFHYNSEVSKKYVEENLKVTSGKIVPITHSGLVDYRNSNSFDKVHSKIHFGFIGPYDYKKGFNLIKKIIIELSESKYNDKYEFHFYGDNYSDNIFKKRNVYNHGIFKSIDTKKVFKNIDILVMPSIWHETFGFVLLEALTYGVPVICSENVGAKDLLPKDLVFNVKDLKHRIIYIINNPQIVIDYKRNIRKIYLPLDMGCHANKIVNEIYR